MNPVSFGALSSLVSLGAILLLLGCVIIPQPLPMSEELALRDRALDAVHRAVRYEHAGSVRAQGIEVLQKHGGTEAAAWLRTGLDDPEPGVRFAAALAVGNVRDRYSHRQLVSLLGDGDASVQAAAVCALQMLGDTSPAGRLPELLLNHPSPAVRRDTAFVLGVLGERGAVKLLARAMSDPDPTVQSQARTSMARLGSSEAIQELKIWANSGSGDRRVLALNALADLASPSLEELFLYKLQQGEYLEVRLAAARGLGMLGRHEGFPLALKSLEFNNPQTGVADPPRNQIMRVRQLATAALGAIGDRRALRPLRQQLDQADDPRIQVAAADAVLAILGVEDRPLPARSASGEGIRR